MLCTNSGEAATPHRGRAACALDTRRHGADRRSATAPAAVRRTLYTDQRAAPGAGASSDRLGMLEPHAYVQGQRPWGSMSTLTAWGPIVSPADVAHGLSWCDPTQLDAVGPRRLLKWAVGGFLVYANFSCFMGGAGLMAALLVCVIDAAYLLSCFPQLLVSPALLALSALHEQEDMKPQVR